MSNNKGPTEGGSGGKRGHSGMEHWAKTAEIKKSSNVHRRVSDKMESQAAEESAGRCEECGRTFKFLVSKKAVVCLDCATSL